MLLHSTCYAYLSSPPNPTPAACMHAWMMMMLILSFWKEKKVIDGLLFSLCLAAGVCCCLVLLLRLIGGGQWNSGPPLALDIDIGMKPQGPGIYNLYEYYIWKYTHSLTQTHYLPTRDVSQQKIFCRKSQVAKIFKNRNSQIIFFLKSKISRKKGAANRNFS